MIFHSGYYPTWTSDAKPNDLKDSKQNDYEDAPIISCMCCLMLQGAECLIEVGADVNIGQGTETPLYHAVSNNNESMVAFLLQHVSMNTISICISV